MGRSLEPEQLSSVVWLPIQLIQFVRRTSALSACRATPILTLGERRGALCKGKGYLRSSEDARVTTMQIRSTSLRYPLSKCCCSFSLSVDAPGPRPRPEELPRPFPVLHRGGLHVRSLAQLPTPHLIGTPCLGPGPALVVREFWSLPSRPVKGHMCMHPLHIAHTHPAISGCLCFLPPARYADMPESGVR